MEAMVKIEVNVSVKDSEGNFVDCPFNNGRAYCEIPAKDAQNKDVLACAIKAVLRDLSYSLSNSNTAN